MLFCFLSSRVNRKRELFKKTKREGNVVAITEQGREDGGEEDISEQEHCPFSQDTIMPSLFMVPVAPALGGVCSRTDAEEWSPQ